MEKKGKKMSLTLFREIFKMDRCLRFKKSTQGTAPKVLYLSFALKKMVYKDTHLKSPR